MCHVKKMPLCVKHFMTYILWFITYICDSIWRDDSNIRTCGFFGNWHHSWTTSHIWMEQKQRTFSWFSNVTIFSVKCLWIEQVLWVWSKQKCNFGFWEIVIGSLTILFLNLLQLITYVFFYYVFITQYINTWK